MRGRGIKCRTAGELVRRERSIAAARAIPARGARGSPTTSAATLDISGSRAWERGARDPTSHMLTDAPLPDLIEFDERHRHWLMRSALVVGGIALLIIGAILGPVPVIPGSVFGILGLAMLGMASRRVADWINRVERKLPYKLRVGLRKLSLKKSKPAEGDDSQLATLAQPGDRAAQHLDERPRLPAELGLGAPRVEAEVGAEHAQGLRREHLGRRDEVDRARGQADR
jgi:hypothetical protein